MLKGICFNVLPLRHTHTHTLVTAHIAPKYIGANTNTHAHHQRCITSRFFMCTTFTKITWYGQWSPPSRRSWCQCSLEMVKPSLVWQVLATITFLFDSWLHFEIECERDHFLLIQELCTDNPITSENQSNWKYFSTTRPGDYNSVCDIECVYACIDSQFTLNISVELKW